MSRWSAVVVVGALLAALLVAAPQRVGAAGALRFALTTDIFNFDPTQLPSGNYIMMNQLYDPLVREDSEMHPQPMLAQSWEFMNNGLVLRLHLRRDVIFASGRPFRADDVVANIKRYQDPVVAANVRAAALAVRDARKIDDATVDLVFDKPDPAVFDLLDFLYIIDPAGVANIKTAPAGTGPFRLTARTPGTLAVMTRNDRYWDRSVPALDRVEVHIVADDPALIANLTSKAVDAIEGPQPIHLASLKQQGYGVIVQASPSLYFDILMNVTSPPIRDKRVRQAVSLAIDRAEFVRLFFQGAGKTAWLPPSLEAAARRAGGVTYETKVDLARARSLMAEAGERGGFSGTLMVPSDDPGAPALAQVIQSNLAQIGIHLQLQLELTAQVRPRWFAYDYQFSLHEYGRANRDPDSLLRTAVVFRPQDNITQFHSDDYSALIDKGATTVDQRARDAEYAEVAKIVLDQAFTVTIASDPFIFVTARGVRGLATNLEGMPILGGVQGP